jgi:capsular polysaccharide export protein
LTQQELREDQLTRAKLLREQIVSLGLTKYNVGERKWQCPEVAQKVILVVGQVECDASIEFGSPDLKTNIELIKRVRSENPDAYIIYKPHPDVIAKLRRQGENESQAISYCDEIVVDVAADVLFSQIDELHTMTSLMGFEALMRGISVICHGLPFYAGWGLTTDKMQCERRTKKLSLDELIFGSLITYPRYFHHKKNIFIDPETAVNELAILTENGIQTRSWYRQLIRLVVVSLARLRRHDRP